MFHHLISVWNTPNNALWYHEPITLLLHLGVQILSSDMLWKCSFMKLQSVLVLTYLLTAYLISYCHISVVVHIFHTHKYANWNSAHLLLNCAVYVKSQWEAHSYTYSGKQTGLSPKLDLAQKMSRTQAHKDALICFNRSGFEGGLGRCEPAGCCLAFNSACVCFSQNQFLFMCALPQPIFVEPRLMWFCVCSLFCWNPAAVKPLLSRFCRRDQCCWTFEMFFYPVTSQPSQTIHIFIGLTCTMLSVLLSSAILHGNLIFLED